MSASRSQPGRCAVSADNAEERNATHITVLSTGDGGQQTVTGDNDQGASAGGIRGVDGRSTQRDDPVDNAEIGQLEVSPSGDEPVESEVASVVDFALESAAESAESAGGSETDLVRSALADARGIVRTTPRRRGRDAARRTRRDNLAGRRRADADQLGGYSAAGPDPDHDPELVGSLLAGYVSERGWNRPLAEARVFAEWGSLVGDGVAAHCSPQSLRQGELRIVAESTAWATQLRLLSSTLLVRLVAELGSDVVTKLHISGPVGPSWKHGGWSVRGARGPRDTYG